MDISLIVKTKKGDKVKGKDYAPVMVEANYVTNRTNSPGKFTFSTVEDAGIDIEMGSAIYVTLEGMDIFKGYIFSAERQRNHKVTYTAYDQLRYLKAKASYDFRARSLGDIIKSIASDFGLEVGEIADTGYKLPSLRAENETCLDIIEDALAQTIKQTGKIFLFYDDYGKLTLIEASKRIWNKLIGDASLLSDYSYQRSIDSDTYNRVKLARPNKDTGRADVYMYEDSATIRQWGLLQYYDTVDENMNAAQIEELCQNYLKYYDRIWQTLKLKKVIGAPELRAGWIIPVRINEIAATNTTRMFLTERISHKITGNSHTMEIEVRNLNDLGGIA